MSKQQSKLRCDECETAYGLSDDCDRCVIYQVVRQAIRLERYSLRMFLLRAADEGWTFERALTMALTRLE